MFRYLIHFLCALIILGRTRSDVPESSCRIHAIIHVISIIYLPIYVIITSGVKAVLASVYAVAREPDPPEWGYVVCRHFH